MQIDKNFWDGEGGGGEVGLLPVSIGEPQLDSGLVKAWWQGRAGGKSK
jgi:hypothetical protein